MISDDEIARIKALAELARMQSGLLYVDVTLPKVQR